MSADGLGVDRTSCPPPSPSPMIRAPNYTCMLSSSQANSAPRIGARLAARTRQAQPGRDTRVLENHSDSYGETSQESRSSAITTMVATALRNTHAHDKDASGLPFARWRARGDILGACFDLQQNGLSSTSHAFSGITIALELTPQVKATQWTSRRSHTIA